MLEAIPEAHDNVRTLQSDVLKFSGQKLLRESLWKFKWFPFSVLFLPFNIQNGSTKSKDKHLQK